MRTIKVKNLHHSVWTYGTDALYGYGAFVRRSMAMRRHSLRVYGRDALYDDLGWAFSTRANLLSYKDVGKLKIKR
jgi:hypothetical protein